MKVEISLPNWAIHENEKLSALPTVEDRMREVIRFSQLNCQNQTGGPFAAGVFEKESGRAVVIGVNRVVPLQMSAAHAEIVALTLAQSLLGTFDLGGAKMPEYQLVVNARPCAMCFGSIPWSGIRSLVVSASGSQVEQLTGFDEGPIHPDWQAELQKRGIEVTENVLQVESCKVLRDYRDSDQPIYNGRLGNNR